VRQKAGGSGRRAIDVTHLHASARTLLDYWERIHPRVGLPGRQHFDPAAVVQLLPNLVLVEVQRAPLRFRYRLVGSRIDTVNSKSLSGQWLDEAYADHPQASALIGEYARVIATGQPAWHRGEPKVVPAPSCRIIEALRLPLASDGRAIDMILGITLYFDAAGAPLESGAHRMLGYTSAETVRAADLFAGGPSPTRTRP
jgi:hypothetical protein